MLKQYIARQMVKRTKRRQLPVEILEQKHVDLSQPFPNDSSYFYGADKDGNAFITRMAFRGPERQHEHWFDFKLKDIGFLGLHQDPGPEGEGFQLGNLKWEPIEIGKIWRITYKGKVTDEDGKEHSCETNLVFTGEHAVYDFAKSSDQGLIAKAIADAKWNRKFFFNLKDTHQVHYEQTGSLTGYILLDDVKHEIKMWGSRDHSFGSRNWRTWDRHYWITGKSDAGFSWTVTTIRFDFLGRLTAGFVVEPDGTVDAVIDCTDLETVSRIKMLPDNAMIELKMRSGKTHTMEFFRNGHFPYIMDQKYMMFEAIGAYKFDKADGLGMVEFGFHSDKYTL